MEHAYGLYTHIQANKRRSIALLIGLFFLVYLMLFAGTLAAEAFMGDASLNYLIARARQDFIAALPWATIGTLAWIFIAYKFHQSMIDAITGGREVTRREEPRLWNLLENLCISRGIPMPKLKVAEDEALNAFASGLNRKQYSVTVTRGLMQAFDDAELESVLGHELTHIRNGDVRMLVIAVVIAGVVSFFGELVFRMFFYSGAGWRRRDGDGERRGSGGALPALLIALGLVAIAGFLSVVIRFALSRQREFLADAGSVELTKNPDAMIGALRKIEGRGDLLNANSAVMEMCVDNPRHDFADLFDTHPPIAARVEALVKYAGGHDPGPLALPPPGQEEAPADAESGAPAGGPWGEAEQPAQPSPWGAPAPAPAAQPQSKPFLPDRPPVDLGGPSAPPGGPWGPRRDG